LARAIGALLADRLGSTRGADLQPLLDVLAPVAQACAQALEAAAPAVQEAPAGAVAPDCAAMAAAPAAGAAGFVGAGDIRSREEVRQALDSVCRYYERHEPGNPAPLLIRRAQRLIDMSFVEILQDLAPESLAQIRTIAGLPAEEKRA
jgi:type VI secretion system protein ImpA